MLKRNNAPITTDSWEEIDSRAKDVLNTYLSARKIVNVTGPKGLNNTVVEEGRLENIDSKYEGVCYGVYKVKPLLEFRVEFELDRWELDNIERGAKDIKLDNLEEAVKKAALFEEQAIYNGVENALISGLVNDSDNEEISFGSDGSSIMESISKGVIKLKEAYVEKPYTLVVGKKAFNEINKEINGYPLTKRIEDLIGGKIIYSHVLDGALLLPYNHDDLEMTIGKDFSIGYHSNDSEKIKFFIAESFTFRVLDKSLVVRYKV